MVLTFALVTGSVLLLGYLAAAASFLIITGLLFRNAPRAVSPIHSSRAPSLDVGDREAA